MFSPRARLTPAHALSASSTGTGSFEPARFVSRKRAGSFNASLKSQLGDWNRDGVPDLLLGWDVSAPAVNLRVLFGGTR